MLDFVRIITYKTRGGGTVVEPDFLVGTSQDLMIRGGAFYAVWDEYAGFWSTDERDVRKLVDLETRNYVKSHFSDSDTVTMKLLSSFRSDKWSEWKRYIRTLTDSFVNLDTKVMFNNQPVSKSDYVTKVLPYPVEKMETPSYDKLMSTIYSVDNRKKLEWAIGSIFCGDSTHIQKFIVLFGPPGSGKSTVLNIIEKLFPGYCSAICIGDLGSSNAFALQTLRDNALVGIEHDGDLSKIETNSRLNSIVSHEVLTVNEKYKHAYPMAFQTFLFLGTNSPVKITDAKSGLLRRLIDVEPSGTKLPRSQYENCMDQVMFELPGIAYHCMEVYREMGPTYYDGYVAENMMLQTNDFYNFIEDNYDLFTSQQVDMDGLPLKVAWRRYKTYCEEGNYPYTMNMRRFKTELQSYFHEFKDRYHGASSVYVGFLQHKFSYVTNKSPQDLESLDPDFPEWLSLNVTKSVLDDILGDCPAQYGTISQARHEVPSVKWADCKTVLSDIDTRRIHYVRPPKNMIVVDFDLKNESGEKDRRLNLLAAAKWPKTYAELSKGGQGIHLHYYYEGDVNELSAVVDKDIEVKKFTGKASLRRKLTWCNDQPIRTINCGIPKKEKKPMLNEEVLKSEKQLRHMILKNLHKEYHPNTAPSVDFIYKLLEEAYHSGMTYDVSDLKTNIQDFCMQSTNQSDHCMRQFMKMHFRSEEDAMPDLPFSEEVPIAIYDVEVFPNLFVICYKLRGEGQPLHKMINPTASEVMDLAKYRLVGYNNRRYDNHILYARMQGYSNKALFDLSQRIIAGDQDAMFLEAYNLSYTDIYDFLARKQSLKKWEIELGVRHDELGLEWDKPVPEELWNRVAEYCGHDVFGTEAVWDSKEGRNDWLARLILSDISGLTPNSTTNSCTTRLIVGNDKHPQEQFVYTDLSTIFPGYEFNKFGFPKEKYDEGTKIIKGKSYYRGEDPGEGGYALGFPGVYANVALLDIASMHPHSAIELNVFGDEYTARFKELVDIRLAVKHKDFDLAVKLLDGMLDKYIRLIEAGEYTPKDVAYALKIAINSVYGLTSASFDNKLRDPRNIDNIVAKYGALFMINLKHEVWDRGFSVAHIKTDSIKIPNATPEIIEFVMEYGKQYGYTFEHEATYERMFLENDAIYVAKYASPEACMSLYGYVPGDNEEHGGEWTATGLKFQIPYVFKTLFSGEPIEFRDMCETKSVTTALYLDFNENLGEDEHNLRFIGKVGLFTPVVDGVGGAHMLRDAGDGKFASPPKTKKPNKEMYRWMESTMVQELGLEDKIDISFYRALVDEAIETIDQYCDVERFIHGDSLDLDWMQIDESKGDEVPFMNEPIAA